MTQTANHEGAATAGAQEQDRQDMAGATPAGFQKFSSLAARRAFVLILNVSTLAVLLGIIASLLGTGGWTAIDIALFACVALSAPWTILGFWNAVIGFILLRSGEAGMRAAAPFMEGERESGALEKRHAIFMTLRNEDPDRAFQRLMVMRKSLDGTGEGAAFDLFVLSDSNDPEIFQREEALFETHKAQLDGLGTATYRRRTDNRGFKAGNVEDFVERWGSQYDCFLPLDADSIMSGKVILCMARMMEQHPKLGILQSLAVGAPNASPFGRIFQFGMRHGMRSFTMGSAWWQGDCGPFWGHNAFVRTAPFRDQCKLPVLPGKPPLGGHILSHDQVESVLMRRAGYEVRVMPVETESFEENPVTLLDFMKREQRWCNGNMQYFPLLGMPNLRPTSRFQLFQAIMMYIGSPAWMLLTFLGAMKLFETDIGQIDTTLAIGSFFAMFAMSMTPKLLGMLDVMVSPGGMRRYGGAARFISSSVLETVFSMLIAPAVAMRLTIFMIGLPFGQKIGWNGQIRDAYGLEWGTAIKALWPQTLFGAFLLAVFASVNPAILPWAAPVIAGLLLAVPVAVVTASPKLGRVMSRKGVAMIPEEVTPSPILRAADAEVLRETPVITPASGPMTMPAE
ncbi:MAG: glucans biosynthesis glucosyltransferase MdoH [Neomegalonema sp.]|nr:glucans biosynthesis glucosyltransferase MdoH [Neomegalonema sp.]